MNTTVSAPVATASILSAPCEIEYVRCNLCGEDNTRELYRSSDHRFEIDDWEWPVVQCRRCGLAYLNPRPTRRAIGRYYPKCFFSGRDVQAQRKRYLVQLGYLDGLRPGELLDIGCANGDWMSLAADRGWRVTGLEPSGNAQRRAGLEILDSAFPDDGLLTGRLFDVITAWAVFEHLHDPMGAFRRAAELLRPGGQLIIMVPNIRSIFSRFSYQEDVPRHLYFFSEPTLRRYASASGLVLDRVDHRTDLFGGAGRGALRIRVFHWLGWSHREYFRFMRKDRATRFRSHPVLATVGASIGLLERLLISDRMVRTLRISGGVVAIFRKP